MGPSFRVRSRIPGSVLRRSAHQKDSSIMPLFTSQQREERLFRKGLERGFVNARAAVETIQVGEVFDIDSVIKKIEEFKIVALSNPESFVEIYIKDEHDETEISGINVYPVGLLKDLKQKKIHRIIGFFVESLLNRTWRKNYFNGYLAEWYYPPAKFEGLSAGHGWTKKQALRSLGDLIVEANLIK